MGITADAYARVLRALLPAGAVWRLRAGDLVSRLLLAAGDEAARVDGRSDDLLAATDPRTPGELLADYERVLGLPSTGTDAVRTARVVAKLITRQRFRPIDFQTVLALVLNLDPNEVIVIEVTAAQAAAMDDARAIYNFYIWRDPSLPGDYDLAGAQAIVDDMKPAHTRGRVIESTSFICDDPFSLCDRDLLGV